MQSQILDATRPESELPEVQAWRRIFSRMGLKPTQYGCGSESLLRRISCFTCGYQCLGFSLVCHEWQCKVLFRHREFDRPIEEPHASPCRFTSSKPRPNNSEKLICPVFRI